MVAIYDNVLDTNLLNTLKDEVMGEEFPWHYISSSAFDVEVQDSLDQGSFSHIAYTRGTDIPSTGNLFLEVANQCLKYTGDSSYDIERVRLGFHTWKGTESVVNGAHVDADDLPHIGGLLYLNDSDGDTIIYEQEHSLGKDSSIEHDVFTEKIRVSPKSNRLVIFDGYHFHASSSPTKHPTRYVLNINWIKKEQT